MELAKNTMTILMRRTRYHRFVMFAVDLRLSLEIHIHILGRALVGTIALRQ